MARLHGAGAAAMAAFSAVLRGRRVEPVDGEAPDHDGGEVEAVDFGTFHDGDLHQPAAKGERCDIADRVGGADHVEDHVDAFFLRQPRQLGGKILFPVVDGDAAEAGDDGAFFRPRPAVA